MTDTPPSPEPPRSPDVAPDASPGQSPGQPVTSPTGDDRPATTDGAGDDLSADGVVLPDDDVARRARERLGRLAVPGAGMGVLTDVVAWAAGVTGREVPGPFRAVRAVVVSADGDRAEPEGGTALATLAERVGATVVITKSVAACGAIDERDALTADETRIALRRGRELVDKLVDEGADLIVVATTDPDAEVAAAAVVASLTGADFSTLLARVASPDGRIDDVAWMRRCALVRDALRRTRERRREVRELLTALGGGTLATVTSLLLRAAGRRTPVLLDGPVGVTAALLARDIAPQVPKWCWLADSGNHPTVRYATDILDLAPLVDLRLGLGEGTAVLATLPLIQAGLSLAAELPVRPAPEASTPAGSAPEGTGATSGDESAGRD